MSERTFVGLRSVRSREGAPDLVALHWSGGIARATTLDSDGDGIPNHIDSDDDGDGLPDHLDPDAVDVGSLSLLFRVLRSRRGRRTPDGLSVHAGIAVDGVNERWAPDHLVTLHAGEINDRSLGIEVCSPGYSTGRAWALERARGVVRDVYVDTIRGHALRMVDYTEAQHDAVLAIVSRWCDVHGIPRRVPTEADGSLVRRQLTPDELRAFSGVVGHFHVHRTKNDPGTAPLIRLARSWGQAVW